MARLARNEYLDPQTIQIVHVTTRCVRRAFLCGSDPVSGNSYEHRREWIRERLEFLASVFAIDCLTFAIMSNHIHLILRSRPDIVRGWSDKEIAERWLRLCPPRKNGKPTTPSPSDVSMIVNDPRRVAELRLRLSDVSWWMRFTAQKIAQQANKEDHCTGRFWEGRYRAQLLLDEPSILACAIYVDLNPIRAAIAQSLVESEFTGAKARIDDLKDSMIEYSTAQQVEPDEVYSAGNRSCKRKMYKPKRTRRWERSQGRTSSGWLSPIEVSESSDPIGPDPSRCGRRASLKGFLTMSVVRYLELLDWTGRQVRTGKRGSIPETVAPILQQLGVEADDWIELAFQFGSLFKRAAGTSVALSAESNQRGLNWMQAPGSACFG